MWVWVLVLVLGSNTALAQDRGRGRRDRGPGEESGEQLGESAAAPPEARARYQAGLEAMENGRWADALEAFRESYEIFPAAPALFNQGVVLRSLGRLREARDTFARLLDEHEEMDEEARAAANQMGAEVAERIAEIAVDRLPRAGPQLRVRFDGSPLEDDGARPLVLEVDPGEHALTVLAEGY
jgi:tetratricopeptide (TPR) repeat protein